MKKHLGIIREIKKYLITHANVIQKRATQQHKALLGGNTFRSEIIEKYQKNHIHVVREIANHLEAENIKKDVSVFKDLGERIAKDSIRDQLTIEEATDGIIFVKQAIWESLKTDGYLKMLTTDEFYKISQTSGTYADIVVSKIAFTFHEYFSSKKNEQEKLKNEFIGIASHELKTPLTSVKAFGQVLQQRFAHIGDEKSALLLRKMDAQLDKLSGLIADLLDVTKIETGKFHFHKVYFDFNELVRETVEEMQRTSLKHKLILKLDKTKSYFGDRDRIGQTIINLLTNAIKYSPQADTILIKSEVSKAEIKVSIQDFGVGIPKFAQDKIFEQFYRVSGKNEETFAGMGIGLYVSAEIIRRHQGKIWVESKKGKGSTFCFALPIKE